MATSKSHKDEKFSPWQALRDIFVNATNKGQLIPASIALIILFTLFKMPGDDVSRLVSRIVDDFENGKLLGWIWATASTAGWFLHARSQRRAIANEMKRLTETRNELQQKYLGDNMSSSDE